MGYNGGTSLMQTATHGIVASSRLPLLASFSMLSGIEKDVNNKVSRWNDAEGRPIYFEQTTLAKQATYSETGFNGGQGLVFSGGQGYKLFGINWPELSDLVIMAAFRTTNPGTTILFELSENFNSGPRAFVTILEGTKITSYLNVAGYNGYDSFPHSYTPVIGTFNFCLSQDLENEIRNWINNQPGTWLQGPNTNNEKFGNHSLYLGCRAESSLFMTGEIAEIRIFGKYNSTSIVLPDALRQQRQRELANLTGIVY